MELLEETALDRTVHSLGYVSVQDFAREQAKGIFLQKIAYYRSRIDFFEQKYNMSFEKFCEKFDTIQQHSMFEKEDDSIQWETALDVLKSYQSDFDLLNK